MPQKCTVRTRQLTLCNLALVWLLWFDPRLQTSGFAKNIRAAVADGDDGEWKDILRTNRVVPDAYLIDAEEGNIYIFEIEDANE